MRKEKIQELHLRKLPTEKLAGNYQLAIDLAKNLIIKLKEHRKKNNFDR